jgi:tetratricopeptide (TPR) repeat protein
MRAEDIEGAISSSFKALALRPGATEVLIDLGNAERARGDLVAAESWYRQANTARPDYWYPLYLLGVTALRGERLDESEAFLQDALKLQPDSQDVQYYLACVYRTRGDRTAAIGALEAALRLAKPNQPWSWWRELGDEYEAVGRRDAAAGAYRKALAQRPHDKDLLERLQRVAARLTP